MATFKLNGADIYYEEKGSGSAIIFTHGHSLFHKQWVPQIDYFSDSYRTVLWDVRGHGNSSLPEGVVDPELFSKDLAALMEKLQLPPAILCGLSMGGHISLQTAVRYPDRVRALVLIGTPFTNTFNWFEKTSAPFSRFATRLIPLSVTARLTAIALSKITPSNHDLVKEAFGLMTHRNFIRHWSGNLRMESKDDLEKVKCPTLILYGDKDKMVGRQQAELGTRISGAISHPITNAHHLTNLDNPNEVNRRIEKFLNEINANSS
ncbi:alpha/beta fold hydrolase [Paenibacillus sp. FJAT-26967]|uniref:alpha/beta fold hydrolase n=1 Tax=Paenibacillus sp. FJAT-26967 TaxID=1729690 RepID=UPI000837C9F2|nr:alpha/beta hydrolase [Paenibacillus sp. FJAT-26967]